MNTNPLLDTNDLPAFDAIAPEHVAPAIDELLASCRAALETAVGPDVPADYGALSAVLDVALPDASFYLWAGVPTLNGTGAVGNDIEYARGLLAQYNVAVLPGRLLARQAHGVNPGAGRIRMALVAGTEECVEAAERIVSFTKSLLS